MYIARGRENSRKYKESGDIKRKPGSGTHSKVNEEIEKIVDRALEEDDERTGKHFE